jgi:pentatricopeptide repeat protein
MMAISYARVGDFDKAIQILYAMKINIENERVDEEEKARTCRLSLFRRRGHAFCGGR